MLLATARSPLLRGLALALALAVHVAARAVGLAVLALMARTAGLDPVPRLAIWDGGWYLRIAEGGYADRLDPAVEATGSLAFYPLYPLLIRAVSTVTGLDGPTAGVLLSELAAAVAAAGLYLLATRLWDRRTGVALVALWSAQPLSIVLSMVYTEALFTALAVWALVALHRRQWLTTGLLAMFAGLTRSSGLGVAAAVATYACWLWWRGQERTGRQILATALATAGPPLWWLWVGLRVDRLDGWFAVQDQIWGSRWDWGGSVMSLGAGMFTQQVRYGGEAVFVIAVTFALLIAAVLLLLEAVAQRVWWPLLVYAAVLLALTLGSAGYINSKPRFLVPIFPLLIPLALAAARAPQRVQLVGGALVLLGSAWFGAYLLVVWPFAI
ncbi:glycosyltransferase family 39 protein [soil metagenome]